MLKGTNKRKLSDSLVERPRQIFLNYDTEGIEPDWETSERATVEDFILAKYYSDYHKFLIDKLEELKSGKKIPMADLIDEFDEPGKWVTRQRYLLMDELGFFKTEKYKTLSQKKKHKIVSIILKCAVRDAEDLVNNKRKYQRTPKDKARVGSFLS